MESGSIVNTSSLSGLKGVTGCDAYTASKGGMISLTRVMAIDYGKYNIRVNCICPGGIATPMIEVAMKDVTNYDFIPLKRIGESEEVAKTALFLASDESSYITGVILPVDGGLTA